MNKKLFFVPMFIIILVSCGKKATSNKADMHVIDKVVGVWESSEEDYTVEIESINEDNQVQIHWNGEKIQTKYVEKTDYNELIFESLDLDKWNIQFYIQPLENDQLLISSSKVEGNQASDSKPITYNRVDK